MTLELTDPHPVDRADQILTPAALEFVEKLHGAFARRRDELLAARRIRRAEAAREGQLDFLPDTRHIRESEWQVADAPPAMQDRRVEMTGPATPAKMAINALNSGAKVWLADLEDASCPKWGNVIDALLNLRDAARGVLSAEVDGREYLLRTDDAVGCRGHAATRLASRRSSCPRRREARRGCVGRLRAALLSPCPAVDRQPARPLLLSAEDGEPP